MPADRGVRRPTLWIALLVALVFARLATAAFTEWDDSDTIARNPNLNPPRWAALHFYWSTIGVDTPGQLYTPVTYSVWTATAWVSQLVAGSSPDADGVRLSPAVFHTANVLLHAATAAIAYRLLFRLFARRGPAAIGALLFALHPVQVEPVAWASGTKDVLCGLFSLAAISTYLTATAKPASEGTPEDPGPSLPLTRARRRRLSVAATLLFLLAMLSKPTAIVVPPMVFAIDVLVRHTSRRTAIRRLWPWALLMIPCALWTRAAQPAPWSATPLWQRPLVAADAVAFYLCKIAWPANLTVDYGHRPAAIFAIGIAYYSWLIPVAVAAVILWRARCTGLLVIVLFLLPLLPVLGLAPFDFQFYSTTADHYLYLPMFAVALLVTYTLTHLTGTLATRLSVVVLIALAVRSFFQMASWQDGPTLFHHALDVNPLSFAACDQLGYSEVKAAARIIGSQGVAEPTDPRHPAWQAAQERARSWYFHALDLQPEYVPALTNIAIVDHRLGNDNEQRWALRRVVDLQPRVPPGLRADPIGLATRLLAAGDPTTAVRVLDDTLRADPTNVPALLLRNRALAMPAN